eukprot:1163077-Rhodomonas_salina.1
MQTPGTAFAFRLSFPHRACPCAEGPRHLYEGRVGRGRPVSGVWKKEMRGSEQGRGVEGMEGRMDGQRDGQN